MNKAAAMETAVCTKELILDGDHGRLNVLMGLVRHLCSISASMLKQRQFVNALERLITKRHRDGRNCEQPADVEQTLPPANFAICSVGWEHKRCTND
jgi:hypothetical protein